MISVQKKKALVLLIKELLDQIDESAILLAQGRNASISRLIMQEIGGVLKELEPELRDLYFEILPTLAAALEPRKRAMYSDEAAELSRNVKQQFIDRIREELDIKQAV
ncbi:MAG: hypothetical protein K1X79_10820 [Oligoflexia bacterium]|nr:hypothetical protein [Oligoflexia bacterium]